MCPAAAVGGDLEVEAGRGEWVDEGAAVCGGAQVAVSVVTHRGPCAAHHRPQHEYVFLGGGRCAAAAAVRVAHIGGAVL